ncbi:MAG: hypothetical protein KAW19_00575 [Candidatus Aminicenantes bacterium]|nr:hypothetical protein [Candidatus Aminicenantes bacterium]
MDELKRRYFEKGATALKRVISIDQDCYCCPICKKFFLPEAIDVGILTIEHAPPKKVGGWPLALTCKDCNSIAGYSIDAAVVHREKLFDALKAIAGKKRNYKGRARLSMGGESINVRIEVHDGTISIKPPKNINDPKKLEAYKAYMMNLHNEGKWDGEKFTISPLASYKNKYSKIGDLKSAFIISFALFGYTYILNKRLSPVREQILNYDSDVIDRYWLASDQKTDKEYFVCILDEPISAVAVRIDKATILLPWFDSPDNFYQYLERNFENDHQFTFHGTFFKWPETLEMGMDFFTNT